MAMVPTGVVEIVRAGENGLRLSVRRGQLLEVGVELAKAVVVEVRRTMRANRIAANAACLYENADVMDRAVDELRAPGRVVVA